LRNGHVRFEFYFAHDPTAFLMKIAQPVQPSAEPGRCSIARSAS
jgi:hypothetical protein